MELYGVDDDRPELLAADTMIEALARQLHKSEGNLALELDELALLLRGLGEYKRGAGGDRGRLLALWTGGALRYERATWTAR